MGTKKLSKTLKDYIGYCNVLEQEYIKNHYVLREMHKLLLLNKHPKLQNLKKIFDEINDIPDIEKEGLLNNLREKTKEHEQIMKEVNKMEKKRVKKNKKSKKNKKK